MNKEIRNIARSVTWGVLDVVVYLTLAIFIIILGLNFFNIGLDPTDKDGFNRSGLRYYKDYGTGIEYISDGSGLIVRSPQAQEE